MPTVSSIIVVSTHSSLFHYKFLAPLSKYSQQPPALETNLMPQCSPDGRSIHHAGDNLIITVLGFHKVTKLITDKWFG